MGLGGDPCIVTLRRWVVTLQLLSPPHIVTTLALLSLAQDRVPKTMSP